MKKALFFSFFGLAVLSTFVFIQYRQQDQITVVGPVIYADGLGRNTIDFASILKRHFTTNIYPTSLSNSDLPSWVRKSLASKTSRLGKVIFYIKPVWELKEKDIKKLQALRKDKKRVFVAYSMFESSQIPKTGVEILNKYFDQVVVPDPYLVEVYKTSGVTRPIHVLPLAIDFSSLKKFAHKTKKNTPFTFTVLSSAIYRKNIIGVIEAFVSQFKNNQDVRLVINSRYAFNGQHHDILRAIHKSGASNISFHTKSLLVRDYNLLLSQSDCLISASMGEGFSIQPREAMVLGVPVIVSNNTAQKTICSTGLVRSVECNEIEPAYHYFSDEPFGLFYKCRTNDLSEAMVDVFQNYDSYLSKSEKAQQWALSYDVENLSTNYVQLFQDLLK